MKSFFFASLLLLASCSHSPETSDVSVVDKERLRAVVKSHANELKVCYDQALKKDAKIQGRLTLEWEILEGGKVGEVKVTRVDFKSTEMVDCAIQKLKTWTFPSPYPNQIPVVRFPFDFDSSK